MEQKYANTEKVECKEPALTTLISEVAPGTNTQSKQAHVLQYKGNRRHVLRPRSPSAGVATVLSYSLRELFQVIRSFS